jgi:hypothetical protein
MEVEVKAGATRALAAILAASAALLLALPAYAQAQVPGRDADPVVLRGAQLPDLVGTSPSEIVGFRWTGSAWDQVPVQVDERAEVSYSQIYNFTSTCGFGGCLSDQTNDVYTDPNTWTAADPDATFDAGDELALMAKDSGAPAPEDDPAGVAPGTRVELELTDPISGTDGHHVYLFESDGGLEQAAGESYVDYDFNLTSGAYKDTYLVPDGPNPETSVVETPYYRHDGLTDRWFDTNLEILNGVSSPVDILDGDKHQFHPSTCARSETTFAGYASDKAEGVFVVNKSGPIRALRSYYGANSGPFTQKTHVYYERRSDVRVDLRVHAIPGVMAFMDFSPAATGMIYRDPANLGGLTIDGEPEAAAPTDGPPTWSQVTGAQGTLDVVSRMTTDISPITVSNYWLDEATPQSHQQCSGDGSAYGLSGAWITSALPNTDPRSAGFKSLTSMRHIFYDAPNQPVEQALLRNQQLISNLGVRVNGAVAIEPGPGPPEPLQGPDPPATGPVTTGKRAAALKKCRKIRKSNKAKRKKCVRKAKKRPL